jgi:hypothetical protein
MMSRFVICCVVGMLVSCAGDNNSHRGEGEEIKLTVNDARQALVAMVESSDDAVLKMSLQFLRTAQAEMTGDERAEIGKWMIDLKERTFSVSIERDPIFQDYAGDFTFDAKENKWKASITSRRQT